MDELKDFANGINEIAKLKYSEHLGINHVKFIKIDFSGNVSIYYNDMNAEAPNAGFLDITLNDINTYIQHLQSK